VAAARQGERIIWTDAPTWIVDPIDGTMNFVHGFPFVAFSIALAMYQRPVVGVVYNPVLNRMYTGIRGHGAWLNSVPMRCPSAPLSLSSLLLITEFSSNPIMKLTSIARLAPEIRGVRALGSAALNLCMVAEGAADAYWEMGIHCWDVAAGAVVLEECGGWLVDGGGWWGKEARKGKAKPFDMRSRKLLAFRGVGDKIQNAWEKREALAEEILTELENDEQLLCD